LSWWFLRCTDKLFAAFYRKAEGFLKLTDFLLISSCAHKRFMLFIKPDMFSWAILSEIGEKSVLNSLLML